jgi:hypothetical protein
MCDVLSTNQKWYHQPLVAHYSRPQKKIRIFLVSRFGTTPVTKRLNTQQNNCAKKNEGGKQNGGEKVDFLFLSPHGLL